MSFREVFYDENAAEITNASPSSVLHVNIPVILNPDQKYWLIGSIQTMHSAPAARSSTNLVDDSYILFQLSYDLYTTYQLGIDDYVSHPFLIDVETQVVLDLPPNADFAIAFIPTEI